MHYGFVEGGPAAEGRLPLCTHDATALSPGGKAGLRRRLQERLAAAEAGGVGAAEKARGVRHATAARAAAFDAAGTSCVLPAHTARDAAMMCVGSGRVDTSHSRDGFLRAHRRRAPAKPPRSSPPRRGVLS